MSNKEMIEVLRRAAGLQTGNIPLKMLLLYAAERIEKLHTLVNPAQTENKRGESIP